MREEQSKNSVLGKLRAESVPELQEERKVQEEKRGKRHPRPSLDETKGGASAGEEKK